MPFRKLLQSALADKSTAYGVSTNIILTNLLINFGLFVGCCLIFSSSRTRPLLRRAFSPRLFYCPGSTPREPLSWNPLQWVYYVRALPDDVFMAKIGLDALMFVKTNACFAQTFAILSLMGCFVLVPINASFGFIRENVHSGGTSLAQYTMANVPEKSKVFYCHTVAAYLATLVAMLTLRRLYLDYVRLRHLHLLERTPQQSTVMLHHIHKDLQSATSMYRFFDALFPGAVANIAIVLRLPKLASLIARHQSAVKRLEGALVAAVQSAKTGPLRRPRIRRRVRQGAVAEPVGWGLGWTTGPGWPFIKVVEDDAIGYWTREEARLRSSIRERRWECAVWHAQFERSKILREPAPSAAAVAAFSAASGSVKDLLRPRAHTAASPAVPRPKLSKMGAQSLDAKDSMEDGRPPTNPGRGVRSFSDLKSVSEHEGAHQRNQDAGLLERRGSSGDSSQLSVAPAAAARGYTDLQMVSVEEQAGALSMGMPSYMREQLASSDAGFGSEGRAMSFRAPPFRKRSDEAKGVLETDLAPTLVGEAPRAMGDASQKSSATESEGGDRDDDEALQHAASAMGSVQESSSFFELVRQRYLPRLESPAEYVPIPRLSAFTELEALDQLRPFADAQPRAALPSFRGSPRARDEGNPLDEEEGCCGCLGAPDDFQRQTIGTTLGLQPEWLHRARPAAIQDAVTKGVHYVLGNPLSSTAFVTFYTLRAASIVRGYNGPLHPTPSAMIPISSAHKADWSLADADAASYTPEPRDVFWKNVCETWQRRPLQGLAGEAVAAFIILTIAVPVAIISGFANVDSLREQSTFINELVVDSQLVENLLALISPLLLMWLINLVPPVLALVQRFGSGEARSMSENQALVFRRFFSFLYYNAFLVLALTTSAYETVFEAVEHPKTAIRNLGISLPKASAFYIQFIIIRTFAGLGFELARINRFLLAGIKYIIAGPDQTEAQRETPVIGCRSFDRPGPLYLGRYYADALFVYLLTMAYSVVAPLVLPFGAMYFGLAYVIFKRQLTWVYEKEYETGGALWPGVQRRCYVSIITSHVVLLCVLAAKLAWTEFALTLPLPVLTVVWQQYMTRIYGSASRSLPLIVAAAADKTLEAELQQSQETFHHSQRFATIRDAYTQPELKEQLAEVDVELLNMADALGLQIGEGTTMAGASTAGSETEGPSQPSESRARRRNRGEQANGANGVGEEEEKSRVSPPGWDESVLR